MINLNIRQLILYINFLALLPMIGRANGTCPHSVTTEEIDHIVFANLNVWDGTIRLLDWINVNITLNPNGHNDWADWWVGYDFNGIRYYLTEIGTVTTTPTTWRQAQLSTTNQSVYSGLLPTGTYTMYFAVDLTRNGILDGNVYWDMITVQVN